MKRMVRRALRLVRKIYFINKTNSPYLSGDLFSDLCDYVAFPPKFRRILKKRITIHEAKSIFCPGDKLETFLDRNRHIISAKFIVVGNSDEDFDDFSFDLPPSVTTCYVQNLNSENSIAKLLPIGVENLRLAQNGFPSYFEYKSHFNEKEQEILAGPFALTHIERSNIQQQNYTSEDIRVLKGRISPRDYSRIANNFKFVLCPRGNGLDTHRFWETLYRGSVPIVRVSSWSQQLKAVGIPLIEVESWAQATLLDSISGYRYPYSSPADIEYLWARTWVEEFNKVLAL